MNKKILFFTLVFISCVHAYIIAASIIDNVDEAAISYVPSIIPPSPNAYKFSTFGNIPLNGCTGGFSYSIPIYNILEKDLSVPISLNYYSTGVKIDELSGIVGTDWSLSVGGTISRVMRDKPDESTNRWYPDFMNLTENAQTIYAIGGGYSYTDVERDWFSFNVNGISGTLYLDEQLNPIVNCKEYIKISFQHNSNYSSFTIIDNKGYTYILGGDKGYLEETTATSTNSFGPKDRFTSAWFLRKIISPNNTIQFSYKTNNFSYHSGISFSLIYDQKCLCSENNSVAYGRTYTPNVLLDLSNSKVLSNINFSNGSIIFDYDSSRVDHGGLLLKKISIKDYSQVIKNITCDYDTVYKNIIHQYEKLKGDNSLKFRLFLKNLVFSNSSSNLSEKYSFDYYEKEKLPIRLSFSKDKYGYNNGSNNTSPFSPMVKADPDVYSLLNENGDLGLAKAENEVNPNVVHYGMLKKIFYPTGGQTLVEYEANSTIGYANQIKYKNNSVEVLKDCSASAVDTATFTFTSNGSPLNLLAGASLIDTPDCTPTPDELHDKYSLTITDLSSTAIITSFTKNYGVSFATSDMVGLESESGTYLFSPITTEKDHKYRIQLKLLSKRYNPAEGSMLIQYNSEIEKVEKTIYSGGARVKKITDYNEDNMAYNNRSFYYNSLSNLSSRRTTLNDIQNPQYSYKTSYTKDCINVCDKSDLTTIYNRYTINSSSFSALYSNRKQGAYYTAVTEIQNNNGCIENFYFQPEDYKPNTLLGPDIESVPYSNQGDAYYGILQKQYVYKLDSGQYSLLKSTFYNYYLPEQDVLSSYVFRKNSEVPAYAAGDYGTYIDNLSIALYYNYIGYPLLVSLVDSVFLPNKTLDQETDYNYGDSPYFNLLKATSTNSNGVINVKKYQYAPNLVGQLENMDKLVEANRVGVPVTVETMAGNTSGDMTQTTYHKTTYQVKTVQDNEDSLVEILVPENIYTPTINDKRISYINYDAYGNIAYYIINDNEKVVYLWSYFGQYPIAEIRNASYDEVETAIKTTFSISNIEALTRLQIPDELLLQSSALQKTLPNAIVRTYTYKPLVGMTSATGPNGVTTYYEYDTFNRLKRTYIIENGQQKTIQSYDYHYQGQ